MNELKLKIIKTDIGYNVEWSKYSNLISYGPGQNEFITEVHTMHLFESNVGKFVEKMIKEEMGDALRTKH